MDRQDQDRRFAAELAARECPCAEHYQLLRAEIARQEAAYAAAARRRAATVADPPPPLAGLPPSETFLRWRKPALPRLRCCVDNCYKTVVAAATTIWTTSPATGARQTATVDSIFCGDHTCRSRALCEIPKYAFQRRCSRCVTLDIGE